MKGHWNSQSSMCAQQIHGSTFDQRLHCHLQDTLKCWSIGTPKIINFLFIANGKLMVFRCPNIQAHDNEAVNCLNFGTPENNEFSIWDKWKIHFLGVPMLKQIRAVKGLSCIQGHSLTPKTLIRLDESGSELSSHVALLVSWNVNEMCVC